MEVYFRDLISRESSLEQLVDDLALVVQGADDYARAVGASLPEPQRAELETRVTRLKDAFQRFRKQAATGARATDRLLRRNLYTSLAITFVAGLWVGARFCCRR
ncbi:MAG TPA: hypothetical protein GYA07_07425 [Verrucomicrobia bacterium]|nr:hypothetical protein [Verrucomicrobiota bacterium]HOB31872.1 hypothetical protein [Verrucomicrobiota bacterium]HOP97051.1 hypothetical protein [Verrucomicrobiota bacterium]